MTIDNDSIKGALAYIDGAIELWPKARRETRVATLLRPLRSAAEAGEIMVVLWVLLLMVPGVGIAVVLNQSLAACVAITLLAISAGWALYAWCFTDRLEVDASSHGRMLRQEFEQVERFFFQARQDPIRAQYMDWEGGNPLETNARTMLRVLQRTKRKLEWLCRPDVAGVL